jgi:hypothetical protein
MLNAGDKRSSKGDDSDFDYCIFLAIHSYLFIYLYLLNKVYLIDVDHITVQMISYQVLVYTLRTTYQAS